MTEFIPVYLRNLNPRFYEMFNIFDKKDSINRGPILAGGALRAIAEWMLNNMEEPLNIKDFDIYCQSKEHLSEVVNWCKEFFEPRPNHPNSPNINFSIGSGHPEIQIITEYFIKKDIFDLYKRFDWTIVIAYYAHRGKNTYFNNCPDFFKDISNGVLRLPKDASFYIDVDRGPNNLLIRAMKYSAKGYYMPQETLDKVIEIIKKYEDPLSELFRSRVSS